MLEFHPFQRRVETHLQHWVELRLKSVRRNDLIVALPILDFSLRQGVEHHQIKRALVYRYPRYLRIRIALFAPRLSDWQEVLVERDMQFGRQHFVRVERVVVSLAATTLGSVRPSWPSRPWPRNDRRLRWLSTNSRSALRRGGVPGPLHHVTRAPPARRVQSHQSARA